MLQRKIPLSMQLHYVASENTSVYAVTLCCSGKYLCLCSYIMLQEGKNLLDIQLCWGRKCIVSQRGKESGALVQIFYHKLIYYSTCLPECFELKLWNSGKQETWLATSCIRYWNFLHFFQQCAGGGGVRRSRLSISPSGPVNALQF